VLEHFGCPGPLGGFVRTIMLYVSELEVVDGNANFKLLNECILLVCVNACVLTVFSLIATMSVYLLD
jgi:hypothetical protein